MSWSRKEIARSCPLELARWHDPNFKATDLARLMNREILRLAGGHVDEEQIAAPPRHGKTYMEQYGAAWVIGNWERKGMYGAYGQEMANEFGVKVRDIMIDCEDLFGVTIRTDSRKKHDWKTTGGGGLLVGGRGSGFTGRGAQFRIEDDLLKNTVEAASKTIRDQAYSFSSVTLATRLEKGAWTLRTNTRWHKDDPIGRYGAKGIPTIRVPAIADGLNWEGKPIVVDGQEVYQDIFDRERGQPLWAEHFPLTFLERQRDDRLGPYQFAAVYQGLPGDPEGTIFKRTDFRYWTWGNEERTLLRLHRDTGDQDVPFDECLIFGTMDTAGTERRTGAKGTSLEREANDPDYTVIAIWARTPMGDLVLLDLFRGQVATTVHADAVRTLYRRWRCSIRVESAMYGLPLIQDVVRSGLPVVPVHAKSNKETRAQVARARYAVHRVYHPDPHQCLVGENGRPWVLDFEDELLEFPFGGHDDQVDVTGYAAAFQASEPEPRIRDL